MDNIIKNIINGCHSKYKFSESNVINYKLIYNKINIMLYTKIKNDFSIEYTNSAHLKFYYFTFSTSREKKYLKSYK